MSIYWLENPKRLRLEDGSVVTLNRALSRAEARRMSGRRRVIASVFPDLDDVTGDEDRIRGMLRDLGEVSELFVWTVSLYSGDEASVVVFDYAH